MLPSSGSWSESYLSEGGHQDDGLVSGITEGSVSESNVWLVRCLSLGVCVCSSGVSGGNKGVLVVGLDGVLSWSGLGGCCGHLNILG